MSKKKHKSALSVSSGVDQPLPVNKQAIEKIKASRKLVEDPVQLFNGIRSGNRAALSQAITIIESALPGHQDLARKIINMCLPYSFSALRLGITGVPGAGKSTFIESFGSFLIAKGNKVAVLAVDPSSERSGGSILGDKTRMELLSSNENAFIRPSPSGGTLGGVARKTREAIILCEAAGYDTIIIETVGVGQSETTVHSMVDFFLVLMIPGGGDELQGMKRGIMELADALIINKADGDLLERAHRSEAEYTNALHLFPLPPSKWAPKVMTCSAIEGNGISEIWEMIHSYREFTNKNGYFSKRRAEQGKYWMYHTISEGLKEKFFNYQGVKNELDFLEEKISTKEISPFSAARELLDKFFPEEGE